MHLHLTRGSLRIVSVLLLLSTSGLHSSVSAQIREGYVDAGRGVRLFYRLVGSSRDTLVVIHGGPGFNMEYLASDLTPLAEHHTLLFYDQRGAGRSTLVRDSLELTGERFADDLEAVRRHFRLERLNMLGHSWGAGVAALYGSRYPERVGRLLIANGIPLRRQELTEAFAQLDSSRPAAERTRMQHQMAARKANPGDKGACVAYYRLWFRPFFADSSAMRRTKGDFCAGTPASRRNKIESVDRYTVASLGDWDWGAGVQRIAAPTLVLHGAVDPLPLGGAREWATTLPNARLLVLENVGHFPYLEAPERFFPAVTDFLNGSWPEGAEKVATSVAQATADSVVRCAPDSLISRFREVMNELEFNHDSSGVEFVPNSGSSDLGTKAQIIRDPATCRRAHEAYVRDAIESEPHPERVAVARAGQFYFIYEYDNSLAVVDRNWKYVAVFAWGL